MKEDMPEKLLDKIIDSFMFGLKNLVRKDHENNSVIVLIKTKDCVKSQIIGKKENVIETIMYAYANDPVWQHFITPLLQNEEMLELAKNEFKSKEIETDDTEKCN